MDKIRNLSLRKTIVLYMIVSLIVSFYLSALIMRMAATIQDDIWWKYVDQEKYFEMAEGEGRKYLTDVPRPNSYEMKKFDYHVSEISKGTVKLEKGSNSSKKIMDAVEDLYLRIADRYTGIRRIEVCANRVAPESYVQYSLFDDPKQTDKERHLQEAVLNVKQRYGKNAIMRGSNLLECSTYRERNEQVGGHRA